MSVNVITSNFGFFEGKPIKKYCIAEEGGIAVCVINYGATITNLFVKDSNNNITDVVLGFETLDGYINAGNAYIGSICGRFANRIANGQFTYDENIYLLSKNNGAHTLHGGVKSFDKVYWNIEVLPNNNGVKCMYKSSDGEEGFPGNVLVDVVYRVDNNALHIEYNAVTDNATPINLTNHSYFNLSGGKEKDILQHQLQLNANRFVEVNEEVIPTGNLLDVKNSMMDFSLLKKVGDSIEKLGGYDHCWVIDKGESKLVNAATLLYKGNGIEMTVYTTQPGIQFYSGNFLDGTLQDTKHNHVYNKYAGLCLEAQDFPDSPNHKKFPNTIIGEGEVYSHRTVYNFHNTEIESE